MSLYAKGWWYQAWLIAAAIPWFALVSLGRPFLIVAFALFLIPGIAAMIWLRCRECRTSIFRVGPDYFPMFTTWPHRKCRGCGADNRMN